MSLTNNKIEQLWAGFGPKIKEIKNRLGQDKISMQLYPPTYFQEFSPAKEFEKWVVVEVKNFEQIPAEMKSFTLKKGLYALFDYKVQVLIIPFFNIYFGSGCQIHPT